MLEPIKVAVIGCGVISDIYLKNLCNFFAVTDVVGCADIVPERAQRRAEAYGTRVMTNEEIYADPDIRIVVNLTYPIAHYEVTRAALLAGKHVYSEKMAAVSLAEGEALLALAREKGLHYVIAPDTFLGGGLQTARYIIDSGIIGRPLVVSGLCQRNYQLNRADSEVRMVHQPGGGLPFDMGGYYLHAFVNMFGPVRRAGGFAAIHDQDRRYLNPQSPLYGEPYHETCINTMAASLAFESGVMGTLTMTSESWSGDVQKIEVIGTEGALRIHDPNDFFGDLMVKRPANDEFLRFPYTHAFAQANMRGLGVADLAYAIRNGRKPRGDAALGLHAFEIIHRVWQSGTDGKLHDIVNRVERPEAMPRTAQMGQSAEGVLDG